MQALVDQLGAGSELVMLLRTPVGRRARPGTLALNGVAATTLPHPIELPGWTRHRLPAAVARHAGRRIPSGIPDAESGLVVCFDPMRFDAAKRLADRRGWPLVTDLMDDWRLHPSMPAWHGYLEREVFPRLSRSGALLTSVTELAASPYPALVVPNAGHHQGEPLTPPAAGPRRPVAAYVGTVHPRIDVDLLLDVKRELADWDIVVAGPIMDPTIAARLARGGITLQPWWEMDRIAERVTVMVCPYARSRFTRSGDPLKIYEATSRGVPCVSTMPVGAPPAVGLTVATPEDFVPAVHAARDLDRSEVMRAARATGSWESRAATILSRLGFAPPVADPLLA